MVRRSIIAVAIALAVLSVAPLAAGAVKAQSKPSKTETRTYDLDFTLPTAGKSGCTVCHGDPNLVRSGDTARSIFVNEETLAGSSHANTACTGCHIDFAYKTPHQNVKDGSEWRRVARQSCKNCHGNTFSEMNTGAHSPAGKPGETPQALAARRKAEGKPESVPLCGDCHGSHQIPYLNEELYQETNNVTLTALAAKGRRQIHNTGFQMCGECHPDESNQYSDYYHGAAYRRGAPDAPACWDCHGAHQMLPADNRLSPVHPTQLPETCGKCHDDIENSEQYVSYAKLIHRRKDVESDVILIEWWDAARSTVQGVIRTITSWFGQG